MATFTDQMKGFTDHLRSSIEDRGEALKGVHQATAALLNSAREFMSDVAQEHRARTTELHAMLDTHRTTRCEGAESLRNQHRDSLQQMRTNLRQMLGETQKARHEAVHQLRDTFQTARLELAGDLREASRTWSEFVSGRR